MTLRQLRRLTLARPFGNYSSTLVPMDHAALMAKITAFFTSCGVNAYLVGGYLRDTLLGKPNNDIDLALNGNPVILGRELARELCGTYVPLDRERGIVRIVFTGVAPTDGSIHVDLAPIMGSLEDDLSRRDFTVDAMACALSSDLLDDLPGNLIDPLGGVQDLNKGILRAVDSDVFSQDPIRLLRGIRVCGQADLVLEEATKEIMIRDAHLISSVSAERIRDEFLLILACPGARDHLYMLDSLGILGHVIPEIEVGKGVTQPKEHYWDVFHHGVETVGFVEQVLARRGEPRAVYAAIPWGDGVEGYFDEEIGDGHNRTTLLKLGALLHDVAKPATKTMELDGRIRFFGHQHQGAQMVTEILKRLRFSNRSINLVQSLVEHHLRPGQLGQPGELPTDKAIYRYFRQLGGTAIGAIYLNLADFLAARGPNLDEDDWLAHNRSITHVMDLGMNSHVGQPQPKLLDGYDLMDIFGLQPGPKVGQLLEVVNEAQASGEVETREQAVVFVTGLAQSANSLVIN